MVLFDLEAKNARVAAEVAINITTEQQEADIHDTSRDHQYLSVCRYGHGYCPREAVCRVSTNISLKNETQMISVSALWVD